MDYPTSGGLADLAIRNRLQEQFRQDVLAGLSLPRKAIPARWFYDSEGSELFEQITRLPEYYPTGAETNILETHGGEIAKLVGKRNALIEFGAGSATKTRLLLESIDPCCYLPVDISGEFLREACEALEGVFPRLPIIPVEADFTEPAILPDEFAGGRRLGFFPGSTIGNFEPGPAVDLLRAMRETLGDGAMLIIGMDRIKDRETLLAAYDDAEGVTARFNLNLAVRINRELAGTIPVEGLRHKVVWNDERARIEMHLEAMRELSFEVCGHGFAMRAGETIHTENSHKYDRRSAGQLLLAGGWEPIQHFDDGQGRFTVIFARAMEDLLTP